MKQTKRKMMTEEMTEKQKVANARANGRQRHLNQDEEKAAQRKASADVFRGGAAESLERVETFGKFFKVSGAYMAAVAQLGEWDTLEASVATAYEKANEFVDLLADAGRELEHARDCESYDHVQTKDEPERMGGASEEGRAEEDPDFREVEDPSAGGEAGTPDPHGDGWVASQ